MSDLIEISDRLSVNVKVSNEEVIKITCNELVGKLSGAISRREKSAIDGFRFVLEWYLTEEEIEWALSGGKF